MDPIQIRLERSGGVGGLVVRGALDTAGLPADQAREAARAVDALEAAGSDDAPSRVPDAQRYELTVTRGGRTRRLAFDDLTLPAAARPLIEALLRRGAS